MKIDRLDAHDRLLDLLGKPHTQSIGECCQSLIDQRPFGPHPFYIFSHARTEDNRPDVKRIVWQPRLTRPKPQTNSMLFKGYPGTDMVKVIWMIPDRCLWDQFRKGNLTQHAIVCESIFNFEHHREKLEQREEDDLSDEEIDRIYREISQVSRSG